MKLRKRSIMAAAEDDSKLAQLMDQLEDDFDYVIAGLEKLDRTGATESNQGLIIAESLSEALQSAVSQIADNM